MPPRVKKREAAKFYRGSEKIPDRSVGTQATSSRVTSPT